MRGQADGLEGVVEAVAAGEARLEAVELVGLAGVGGAEALGVLELLVVEVDGHDHRGTGDLGALMQEMPTPPQPNTTTERAGRDLGGVDGGADAGHHAAADQAADLERDVVVDLHDALVRDDHLLGEGAGAGHAEHGLRRRG